MKALFLLACITILLTPPAMAQIMSVEPKPVGKNIDIKDVALHVGEFVNLCDTVHYYKKGVDSLILFCMGGKVPPSKPYYCCEKP